MATVVRIWWISFEFGLRKIVWFVIRRNVKKVFFARKVLFRILRKLITFRNARSCTFQENCKYSGHVRAKLIEANKCLFVLRSLRKEDFGQGEVDHLFSALVLPNFTYGLPVYGAVDSDLTVIQNFLDRCFKRKYTSKRMDIRELLEKADKKLFKVRSVDPDCPLSNIIPKKKETMYQLRNNLHGPYVAFCKLKKGEEISGICILRTASRSNYNTSSPCVRGTFTKRRIKKFHVVQWTTKKSTNMRDAHAELQFCS